MNLAAAPESGTLDRTAMFRGLGLSLVGVRIPRRSSRRRVREYKTKKWAEKSVWSMVCAMELGLVKPPSSTTSTSSTTVKTNVEWPVKLTTESEFVPKPNVSTSSQSLFADSRKNDPPPLHNDPQRIFKPEEHHPNNNPSFIEHPYSLPAISNPSENSKPTKSQNPHRNEKNRFSVKKTMVFNPFHDPSCLLDPNRERINKRDEKRTSNVLRENNRDAEKPNLRRNRIYEKNSMNSSRFVSTERRYFRRERDDSTRSRTNTRMKISVDTMKHRETVKTIVPVARVQPQTSVFRDFAKSRVYDLDRAMTNQIRKLETNSSSSDDDSSLNEAQNSRNLRKKRGSDDKKNWGKTWAKVDESPKKKKITKTSKLSRKRKYYGKSVWSSMKENKHSRRIDERSYVNESEKENYKMADENGNGEIIENRRSIKFSRSNVKMDERKTIRVENETIDSDVDETLLVNPSTDLPNALLEINDDDNDEIIDLNPLFDIDFDMNFQTRETSTMLDSFINSQAVTENDDDVGVDVETENSFNRPNCDNSAEKFDAQMNANKTPIIRSKKRRSADSLVAMTGRSNKTNHCNDKHDNNIDNKNVRITRGSIKNLVDKSIAETSSTIKYKCGTIVWGNCTGWWPGLIIDAEEVGMSSSEGKSWIYWIGEHRISHLRDKTQIQLFSCDIRKRMVEILRVKPFKDVNYAACLATIKLVNDQILQRGPLTKPYHAWVEKHLLNHENIDRLILQPYPSSVQKRLDELRVKNTQATEKYLREVAAEITEKSLTIKINNVNSTKKSSTSATDSGYLPLSSQKPGVITWAKIMGQIWWPAMIIDFRDCGMKEPNFGCQWILWYGDYTLSQVNHRFFLDFAKGLRRMKNYVLNCKREIYRRGVVEAAKDYCSRYGYKTESWILNDVFDWFFKLDDDEDDENFTRDSRQNSLPGIPANAGTSLLYPTGIIEGLRKHKGNCTVAAIREHNIKDSDALNRAIVGKYDVKNLCLMCLNDCDDVKEKITMEHPFFVGKLCYDCSEKYLPTIFAYGDDGKCFFCTVCAGSDTVVICDETDCPRVYCTACLKYLIAPTTYDDIMINDPFVCFVCVNSADLLINGLLKPREDWKIRVQRLFGGNRDSVPNRVENCKNGKKKLRVLSLFDGITAGLVVLDKLGIHVDAYYASEIDGDAEMIGNANFGDRIVRLGDVRTITEEILRDIAPIHLLIGGSPCNDLSLVNPTRRGLHDPNGTGILVFEYSRIKKLIENNNEDEDFFWMFENVASMPSKYRLEINEHLGREPNLIDAANYSPQHRPRLYWNNFPMVSYPLSSQDLQDVLTPNCNRHALVKKIRTVTTRVNSLKQGKLCLKPILMNEENDSLWITELEEIFGFPKHYTDVKNLCATKRQRLIGKSWSVQTIAELMRPLCNFFESRGRESF